MIEAVGWDIGGAHLKAAAADSTGAIIAIVQRPYALWKGIEHLDRAMGEALAELLPDSRCRHAVTMTGELVDCFASRDAGVTELLRAVERSLPDADLHYFVGYDGLLAGTNIGPDAASKIGSANWLATAFWCAESLREGLLVDIGSTTTDVVPIADHRVAARGYADNERMRYDELIYTGAVRTPAMVLASRVPFDGEWFGLMAEHFATAADVYTLTGELPDHADQWPAADGGPKTVSGSRRRLARMVGCDLESALPQSWDRLAGYFRERQLDRIRDALERQLSRGMQGPHAPLIGAGVGRFLVKTLAERMGRRYLDFGELFPVFTLQSGFSPADCAPAAALAGLAVRRVKPHDA